MPENRGLKALEEGVLAEDLCVGCGACASLCPYLRSWEGRIVKLHNCDLSEGRCFDYCPRTEVDLPRLHQAVFGQGYQDLDMGPIRRVVAAQAVDPDLRDRGQTGGVVSALMSLALREGSVQAAVLTERRSDLLPEGRIVRDPTEVAALAGSSYVAGFTLEALNQGSFKDEERIGLVGLPCQVTALAKMRASTLEKRTPIERVALVIGLFCTWTLNYGPFKHYLTGRVSAVPIRKMDVTPPPDGLLKVITDSETLDIPLDEIRPFIRPGCGVCLDMTAELADLSVGTVEGQPGWNTVVIRSRVGEDLFTRAQAAGMVETRALTEDYLHHLREASRLKKHGALKALEKRGGAASGYLQLPDQMRGQIMSQTGEKSS